MQDMRTVIYKHAHGTAHMCMHTHCTVYMCMCIAHSHTLSILHSPDWNIAGHQGPNLCVLFGHSSVVLLPWCDEVGIAARVLDISYKTGTS